MFESGTASGYLDLLDKLNTFLTAKGSAFSLAYSGTGNGTLTAYSGGASSVAELFTITATSATNFTVVGSVSGSIGPATVGTPFAHAKVEFLLTAGGTAFISGDEFLLSTAPKWTALLSPVTATSTRWRVRALTTVGGGSWDVAIGVLEMALARGGADQCTGGTPTASSENGAHVAADAFDGSSATYWQSTSVAGWIEYEFAATKAITEVRLTHPSGGSLDNNAPKDFVVEYWDSAKWVPVGAWRNEAGQVAATVRTYPLEPYIWEAPGNDGTSTIHVGVHPFENAGAGWYNWRLNAFTAYAATADWFSQAGGIVDWGGDAYGPILPLTDSSMGYWFVANGRRVIVVTKTGSTYGAAYLGLIAPYASPGQWPYPVFVGGALYFDNEPDSDDVRWTVGEAHDFHTLFPRSFLPQLPTPADEATASSARLRKPDGSWLALMGKSDFYDTRDDQPATLWPYAYGFLNLKPDLDGEYALWPVILHEHAPANTYGQLDGVFAVTGSGLSPEAAITEDLITYTAFPDATRNGPDDFFAVKMD